jgi:hypothetical protein
MRCSRTLALSRWACAMGDPMRVCSLTHSTSAGDTVCVSVVPSQVLHGCSSDVIWLQRDFGVYLVNVFDTGEAAKQLHYPSHGLAHLLEVFCKVAAQKQFQVRVAVRAVLS